MNNLSIVITLLGLLAYFSLASCQLQQGNSRPSPPVAAARPLLQAALKAAAQVWATSASASAGGGGSITEALLRVVGGRTAEVGRCGMLVYLALLAT